MHNFIIFDCIKLSISDEDWNYLCQNRWFTNEPKFEDIKAEFVSGTGITPSKQHLWDKATLLFHEYVVDLMEIQKTDTIRFVMDETSAPYEQNENPFPQTDLDNEFEEMIIKKYNLTTKEMETVN